MELDTVDIEKNLLPPADWAGEIERLQENISNERDRNLRTLADFKNYRRRIEREGNTLAKEGKRELILPLLDIVDDLEKVLTFAEEGKKSSVKGIEIIHLKILSLLAAQGVHPFQSLNTPFNYALHEAVAVIQHKDKETKPETVVDELRRGYFWNEELLRAAQVRVSK
ncbi:MAG: nucleotide exchange factor GrpE [Bacteroidota bacterium]